MPHDVFVILAKVLPYLPEDVQQRIHEWVGAMVNQQFGH